MKKPAAADEKAAASAVAAEAEPSFPWSPDGRKAYPDSEERTENGRKHYASLQKYYAARSGLEESQALPGSDGMAALALQQEAAEEEVQATDEMVDAEASQACQPKGSQDGVEGKEEHVKQGQQARMRGLRHSRKSSRRGLKQGQQAKMTNLRQSQKRSRRGLKQSQQAKNFG